MERWHPPSGEWLINWHQLLVETQFRCRILTFKDNIWLVSTLWLQSTSLSDLPILPKNMPYYRGLGFKVNPPTPATDNDDHQKSLAYSVLCSHSVGSTHVSNHPVQFGIFDTPLPINSGHCVWYNNKFPAYVLSVSQFNWVFYSFNSGHFSSLISTRNLPFNVTLACDPFACRQALMEEFTSCKGVNYMYIAWNCINTNCILIFPCVLHVLCTP